MEVDKIGVHVTHCCVLHGCKYGDEDCPVEKGEVEQEYPCEYCNDAGIYNMKQVKEVFDGKVETCPHCGHVI